jgi:capsular polysaccharide transport system ATP-binding protein
MIELKNVTKSYPVKKGKRYILRDVSILIPSRVSIGIIGPNGAGKSTFLRIISGTEAADSGTIISDADVSWPLGLTSGFKNEFTGRQNVSFVCRINGLTKMQTKQVIDQVTNFAEIGEYFDMPVETYSSGMRGRLSFGLSMAFKFDVYLVDELTSVGDQVFREKAKAAFQEIRKNASLIYISHNLKSLQAACQSGIFIREGMADFYPEMKDAIKAYLAYVRDRKKQGKTLDPKDKRNLQKTGVERRSKRQANVNKSE